MTDDELHALAIDLHAAGSAWKPDVCIVGNVTAGQVASFAADTAALLARAQQAEVELAALRRAGRDGNGAMNAIEILTADRDDWKRHAERAEAERDRAEERVTEGEALRLSAEIAEQHAKDDARKAMVERDAALVEVEQLRAVAEAAHVLCLLARYGGDKYEHFKDLERALAKGSR